MNEYFTGDDVSIPLTVYDVDDAPVNLTGSTLKAYIKDADTADDTGALASYINTTHVDATNGKTQIDFTSAQTATLTGKYYFVVRLFDALGHRTTLKLENDKIAFLPYKDN